jgi:2-oxoisovalerate dehydrogenase E1 component alpha subunit
VPFEKKLEERGILTRTQMDELRAKYTQDFLEASKRVREEPQPTGADIWKHVFAEHDVVNDFAAVKRNGA